MRPDSQLATVHSVCADHKHHPACMVTHHVSQDPAKYSAPLVVFFFFFVD